MVSLRRWINSQRIFVSDYDENLRIIEEAFASDEVLGLKKPYSSPPPGSDYTITTSDFLINCTSGTSTLTLPTAVGNEGRQYVLKNSGVGVITVATDGSETIDDQLTQTIDSLDSMNVFSDGTNWVIT